MSDLTFAEGLNMLEDAELSPWVKVRYAVLMSPFFNPLADQLELDRICWHQSCHQIPGTENVQ
jgi:hypothetical protein